MKRLDLLIIPILIWGTSCGKDTQANEDEAIDDIVYILTPPEPGDVYVAGYEANGQEYNVNEYRVEHRYVAMLWKNGAAKNLTDGKYDASAESIYVSGNDVYVVGYEASGQKYTTWYGTVENRFVAKLWKNGEAQNLTDGTRDAYARSVFVSNGDVYVAGWERSGQEYKDNDIIGTERRYVAKLWKNGVAQNLTDGTHDARAASVFVSGNDVYVAGSENSVNAILWKNGEAEILFSSFYGAVATSVFVAGDNVYVAGVREAYSSVGAGSTINSGKLFTNGAEQNLNINSPNSVYVSGDDVYVVGTAQFQGTPVGTKLWKNGVEQYLADIGFGAYSVYVTDKDVYVAGRDQRAAMLSKNDVSQNLTDGTFYASANSVFVVE